jgi:hypothetical protein
MQQPQQYIITAAFLKNDPTERAPLMNSMTSILAQISLGNEAKHAFMHTECLFHEGNTQYSSSLYNGEPVGITEFKEFKNPNYTFVSASISPEQNQKVVQFCKNAVREGHRFHQASMFKSLLPFSIATPMHGDTFCSKYVTEVMQAAGIPAVQGLNADITTPTKLYNVLLQSKSFQVASTVASRHRMITAEESPLNFNIF